MQSIFYPMTNQSENTSNAHPVEDLNLWTAVDVNIQRTHLGVKEYPLSEYPIKWFLSLEAGPMEEVFAKEVASAIREEGQKNAKMDKFSLLGINIYGYFRNSNIFRSVLKKAMKGKTLRISDFDGETKEITADDLLKDAQKVEEKAKNAGKVEVGALLSSLVVPA
jgi:hypothetical protein